MTDVKLEPCPFCGNDGSGPIENALHIVFCEQNWGDNSWSVQCDKCTATMGYSNSEAEAIAAWNARHQPQREAVLEQALLQCASRFSAYAELHAEKLWDGSLSEAQRQTVRDKVDRNLRYAAEARAAIRNGDTT